MGAARTRYELRVGTVISEAALATFRIPVRPTAVPRNTVYRFRRPGRPRPHRGAAPAHRARRAGRSRSAGAPSRDAAPPGTPLGRHRVGGARPLRRPPTASSSPSARAADGGSGQPADPCRRTCTMCPTTAPPSNTVLNDQRSPQLAPAEGRPPRGAAAPSSTVWPRMSQGLHLPPPGGGFPALEEGRPRSALTRVHSMRTMPRSRRSLHASDASHTILARPSPDCGAARNRGHT